MNDAYLLELIFENEFGNKQYMYFGHDRFQLNEFPTHRSLMELNSAKAKRTKVLKDFKQGHWKGLKDIKIRRAHIRICEEVEMKALVDVALRNENQLSSVKDEDSRLKEVKR